MKLCSSSELLLCQTQTFSPCANNSAGRYRIKVVQNTELAGRSYHNKDRANISFLIKGTVTSRFSDVPPMHCERSKPIVAKLMHIY